MQQLYIKDGKIINTRMGVDTGDGSILYNGTPQEMAALGYEPYTPESYVEPQESVLQRKIDTLKEELAAEDYKIIKCYEAQLLNNPIPYDITNLIIARDARRAQINEYEDELEHLNDTEE